MSTTTHNPFHVTVAAVVERDGRYLMVEETIDGQRVYNQPAGHLEPDESIVAAVVRETLEETARPFTPTGLVGIYRWQRPDGEVFVRFAFSGEVGEPEPGRALDPDIDAALWLSEADLAARADRMRSPLVMQCIHDLRAHGSRPLDLLRDLA